MTRIDFKYTRIALMVVTFFMSALITSLVMAQSTCPLGATIRLEPGFSVNVRSGPGAENPIVRNSLTSASGNFVVLQVVKDSQGRDWFRIGQEQWVIGSFWTILCPTPIPPTRTSTATRTPVIQVPTPTRIVTTPTVAEAVAVTINGVTYICELPCEFRIEKP